MAPRVDLSGVQVQGWTVSHKAPAQNRVPFWACEHDTCGAHADIAHVTLTKAVAGKATLPSCTTCVPAEDRRNIEAGMHLACGQSHLIGTPCRGTAVIEPVRTETVWNEHGDGATVTSFFDWSAVDEADAEDYAPKPVYTGHPADHRPGSAYYDATHPKETPAPDAETGALVIHGRVDRLEEPQGVLDVIRRAMLAANTRGLQSAIGPSQIGTPCERKLGFMLIFGAQSVTEVDGEVEYVGDVDDLWRPMVGTIVHAWLDKQFKADGGNWLASHRVGGQAPGTIDIAEVLKRLGIDFKVVAPSVIKKVAAGPQHIGEKYETQLDIYGLGLIADGYLIDRVALLFLPKAGSLKDAVWYSRPLNPQRALDAFARRDRIGEMVTAAQMQTKSLDDTARVLLPVLPTADDYCGSCPALGKYCKGAQGAWLGREGLPDSAWPAYDAAVKALGGAA